MLFRSAKNNTGEAIFQAQFLTGVQSSSGIQGAAIPLGSLIRLGDGNGTYNPSIEYYNSYPAGDKRAAERGMFFTRDFIQASFDPTMPPSAVFSQPALFKFWDQAASKVTGSSSLNWSFYRYADILLMQTEVNWTLNQHTAGTVPDADVLRGINLVRARAGIPLLTSANIDLKAIMAERAYELVFETKMLWDQRRTRRCLVDGSGTFSSLQNFFGHQPNGFSYAFGAKHLLAPIGLTEIQNNGNCLQSFGYLPKQTGQQ